MRRKYVWSPEEKRMVEVATTYTQPANAPAIFDDLPGYESPVNGKWVEGRRARREDLKRTGCRPYEGRDQEEKAAQQARTQQDHKLDQLAEKMAHQMWENATTSQRKILRGR